jgi:hypothetical protein
MVIGPTTRLCVSKFVEGIGAHSTPRQIVVHKVTADGFKTGRKKKDPKRKKERAEAKDVAKKGGGSVVGQGKVEGVAEMSGGRKSGARAMGIDQALLNAPYPGLNLRRTGKLMQHARDWYELAPGHHATKNQITLLENLAKRICGSPQIVKQGSWRRQIRNALFYSSGRHIVVTRLDGTFVTILKNAHESNRWFKEAVVIKK